MELKDFIKETLLQIASGARLADDEYRKLGNGGVNPEGKFHLEGIPHILCPITREILKESPFFVIIRCQFFSFACFDRCLLIFYGKL